LPETILHDLESLVAHYGYWGVAFCITLESFGAPLPAESLLVVAAWVAGQGKLDIVALLLVAWAAAVAGDSIGYWIGRLVGHKVIDRFGPYVGAKPAVVEKFRGLFRRYGPFIVIVARLVEVLRQINGILAGTMGMPWWRFLLFNAVGGALWVGLWGVGAYVFGEHIDEILLLVAHHKRLSAAIALVLVLALIVAVLLYRRRRRAA